MQQRSEETRSKIIFSAVKLFSAKGYNTASVDDICADAGISKGAFYHHFRTKQDLFLALLDGWLETIDNAIEASKDKTVPETFMQITEAFPYIFATANEGLPMFLEFWLQANRDEKIWQASVKPYRRYHKYFTDLIKKGVDEGSFVEVDPDLASRMIISTAMGLLLQSLMDPKGAKWEKVARDSTTMLVASMLKNKNTIQTTNQSNQKRKP
ncbi:MAG TPA: TetR/AcrR family transcriptional regulator [Anaerolineales bacterium]|nr:TetR/AcrR family transcriptional regulator [Anaerolineales bacterium]